MVSVSEKILFVYNKYKEKRRQELEVLDKKPIKMTENANHAEQSGLVEIFTIIHKRVGIKISLFITNALF